MLCNQCTFLTKGNPCTLPFTFLCCGTCLLIAAFSYFFSFLLTLDIYHELKACDAAPWHHYTHVLIFLKKDYYVTEKNGSAEKVTCFKVFFLCNEEKKEPKKLTDN